MSSGGGHGRQQDGEENARGASEGVGEEGVGEEGFGGGWNHLFVGCTIWELTRRTR
jgi:hypothetical protein